MRWIFAAIAFVLITVVGGESSETVDPKIGLHVAYFTGVVACVAFYVIVKGW